MNLQVFIKSSSPGAVIFVSGTGTNAEKLLESSAYGVQWSCRAIVTDRSSSAAAHLSEKYDLPLINADIRGFRRGRGTADSDVQL